MRNLMRVVFLALLWAAGLSVAGADPENLLRDPGFEQVSGGVFARWSTPTYWQGKLSVANEAHGGRRAALLSTTERAGKWLGRVYNPATLAITQGARYRLSIWAKGKGDCLVGCIEYARKEGKATYQYVPVNPPVPLSEAWQPITFYYTPQDPLATTVAVYAEVRGEGSQVLLDDAHFGLEPLPGYALTVRPEHTMVPVGSTLRFRIEASGPAGRQPAAVSVRRMGGEAPLVEEVALDATGKGEYLLRIPEGTEPGVVSLSFVLKDAGLAVPHWADVVDGEAYRCFADAAAGVRLEKPAHLLFVGDSLTAFYRGYNYVDKVRGWLHQRFGEEVTVTNAGVGGDYTTRVLARLEKGVLAKKPTHVFVFLGHNDSKLKSGTGYRDAVVPPEVFEREYREIVQRVRAIGARVTVISATSSVYEITKASAEAAAKAGRVHNLFGKPEVMEQFNAIARKVAEENGCGYLDVYEPTRTHPKKASLFTQDGVHINNDGNRLVALEILKYLGKP